MIHSRWSGGDLIFYDGTQDIMTIKDDTDGIEFGVDSSGADVKFFGDTANAYMEWDASNGELVFDLADIALGNTDFIMFGDSDNLTMNFDGTQFVLTPASSGLDMHFGSAAKPLDVVNYGDITYRTPQSQTSSSGHTITLNVASNRIQFLNSTGIGGFNVIVPSSSGTGVAGIEFKIFNSSSGDIPVYENSTGVSAFATIGAGEGAIVCSNATDWKSIIGTT